MKRKKQVNVVPQGRFDEQLWVELGQQFVQAATNTKIPFPVKLLPPPPTPSISDDYVNRIEEYDPRPKYGAGSEPPGYCNLW